ncbi:unnamed protein product, partial [Ectocarpus sp. 8 AP-2014]
PIKTLTSLHVVRYLCRSVCDQTHSSPYNKRVWWAEQPLKAQQTIEVQRNVCAGVAAERAEGRIAAKILFFRGIHTHHTRPLGGQSLTLAPSYGSLHGLLDSGVSEA